LGLVWIKPGMKNCGGICQNLLPESKRGNCKS
jgi:hypothetical protein